MVFDPSEKICLSKWVSSSPKIRGENQKSLKPPPRNSFTPPKIHSKYMLNGTIHIDHLSSIYHGYPWVSYIKATRVPACMRSSRCCWAFSRSDCRVPHGYFWLRIKSPGLETGKLTLFGIVKIVFNEICLVWGESWWIKNESDPLEEVEK